MRYYPGHYSSGIPGRNFLIKNENRIFDIRTDAIAGVNLNEAGQLSLLEAFSEFIPDFVFPEKQAADRRYFYHNPMFGYNDAFILYSFIRYFKPKRIIEVGSGFSSALLLDTVDITEGLAPEITFIEPFPGRLNSLMRGADRQRVTILEQHIQDVPVALFRKLGEGDLLFVDTSHVLKIDSDLSRVVFSILPTLGKGVLIHFHDIFWPFEYPKVIMDDGRLWNEAYFLRSFLQYNDAFEILFFTSYLENSHGERMIGEKTGVQGTGSSLWLRKKC